MNIAEKAQGGVDFRAMAETCPAAILQVDAEGQCTYVNACCARLLDVADPLGLAWMQAVHPLDRAIAAAMWHRPYQTLGIERILRLGGHDTPVMHVRLRASPLTAPDGGLRGYVVAISEISPSASKLERLESANAFLAKAEVIAGVGCWRFDIRTRELLWTSNMRRIHELPDDYVPRGDEHVKYFAQEARVRLESAVKEAIAKGTSWDVQMPMSTATGREIWVRSVGEPERQDGRMTAVVGVLHDLTQERRHSEELRSARDAAAAASEAKTRFLATMSHEFRTPLNGIVGMGRLLLDEGLTPAAQQRVELVDRNAHALLALVDSILDLAQLESGELRVADAPFDLYELFDELAGLYRPAAAAKGLDFRRVLGAGVPRLVRSDRARVRQVLGHLLDNAVKFTPQGSVALGARLLAGEPGMVEFTITDTGVGIEPAFRSQLFQPFTQADAGDARRFGGSGLGLSIVHRLVALLGGEVQVTSAPGEGTCLRVRLRLPSAASVAPPRMAPAAAVTQAKLRVLVVDDHPTNRVVAATLLGKLGCEQVDMAEDGGEAVTMATDGRYDLILMDCQMPVLDGYAATIQLRAAQCRSRIVALTADASRGARERCLDAGMDDYMHKPVGMDGLQEELLRCAAHAAKRSAPAPVPRVQDPALLRRLCIQACERCASACEGALEDDQRYTSPGTEPYSPLHLSLVSCASVCRIVASSLANGNGNTGEMVRWCAEVCHSCSDIVRAPGPGEPAREEVAAACDDCAQACEALAGMEK